MSAKNTKILFVINKSAGPDDASWEEIINNFFKNKNFDISFYHLHESGFEKLGSTIKKSTAKIIVAVGGDGTVALVAKSISGTDAALGIVPAGSANGMAKELAIPLKPEEALAVIEKGDVKNCDAIRINQHDICLHLSDIGLNAQLIKYFDEGDLRGQLGYAKVILKTLVRKKKMKVAIKTKTDEVYRDAFMVVLANASKYGTGAVINPEGEINDGEFEVVIVRKLAFLELMRMMVKPGLFNPKNIEILKATNVNISTNSKFHFQIDGEYKGKINKISASIVPSYIKVIL